MILQFPYYLTLQIVPLVAVREKLTQEEEPQQRRLIVNEIKTFTLFALGYQDLLRKILTQQQLLYNREKETRKAKLLEESLYRFDLHRFMIMRAEKETRQQLTEQMVLSWRIRLAELEASISTLARHAEQFEIFMVGIRAFQSQFRAWLLLAEVYRTWCQRMAHLQQCAEEYGVEALRRKRDVYTESRIASCIAESQRRGVNPELLIAAIPNELSCALL